MNIMGGRNDDDRLFVCLLWNIRSTLGDSGVVDV